MAKVRKTRSDRRGPLYKMAAALPVKLTPASLVVLSRQAKRSGFKSAAAYLRHLATMDRERLGLTPYDFNTKPSPPPVAA